LFYIRVDFDFRLYFARIKSVSRPLKLNKLTLLTNKIMAIVQNPITGRTKKKFGTAVFSKQFGKNTMRAKPLDVKNPKTAGQVKQRTKFKTVVELIRQVLPLINEVYAGSLRRMSPFNKVTSFNIKTAFTGEPPVLDHTKLELCDFNGSSVNNVTLTGQVAQVMDITWDPHTNEQEELDTPLTFVMFNCSSNLGIIFRDVALRSAGVASVTLPPSWVGAMTSLHIVTTDVNQKVKKNTMKLIKFKAGADPSSVVL
jgi:hypothetical protein